MMICFFVSKYIDGNAEKLRKRLVRHEGVKTLKITECPESEEESLLMEESWDNFFNQTVKKIEEESLELQFPAIILVNIIMRLRNVFLISFSIAYHSK